jgi:hypothetical protein
MIYDYDIRTGSRAVKNGGYIQFSNRKTAQWLYVLPELAFHLVGLRSGKRELFPKKCQGVQISFTWLWFNIFYSSVSDDILFEIEPFEW